jgi:hypothetical protein
MRTAVSLRLKPSSAIKAPPFLRFQTEELSMLIVEVQKSDENQIRFCNWKTASGQVEYEVQK